MILYKTKYYGLLGDRVRKAIAESGRKHGETYDFVRRAKLNKYGETPTHFRTLRTVDEITNKKLEKIYDNMYKDIEKYPEKYVEIGNEVGKKANAIRTERNNLINKYKDNLTSNKLKDTLILEKERILDNQDKRIEELNKKHPTKSPRKNPNDELLMEDIKDDFYKRGGKEFKVIKDEEGGMNRSYYNREGKEISTVPHPSVASHENNHFKNDINNETVNNPYPFGGIVGFDSSPKDVHSFLKYLNEEESKANRKGFRDIFLNKHSGGRDWRATHYNNMNSNKSHFDNAGIDLDKVGMQDLDYNMSPEALKKMRENAKKLGIDLNKTNKVSKETPTKEQLNRVMKYVEENKDRL